MWQPTVSSDELYHHGILGMKWGVRRYQNKDGSLTAAGRKRYDTGEENSSEESPKKKKFSLSEEKKKEIKDYAVKELKKTAITTAAVAGTIVAAYASYKISTSPKLRGMIYKGMLKINAKQSVESLIENSGPEIVRKTGNGVSKSLEETFKNSPNVKVYKNGIEMGRAEAAMRKAATNRGLDAANSIRSETDKISGRSSAAKALKEAQNLVSNSKGSSNSDLERLIKNSKKLSDIAKSSASNSSWATEYDSYARELLKKNSEKLSRVELWQLKDWGF